MKVFSEVPACRGASKPDCGVCTDEQNQAKRIMSSLKELNIANKPYTEAMRSDEVTHHAEVQTFQKEEVPK
ncbi:hypothetical protein [Anditalea andensis]|uniref:Uncharacterized protein n=2 Tax=Anditalea andensis TaxID=1048983 RepID=A0A074L4J0_9BACT|nr:hypothetical protein [Anditalea andensis]KEO75415.1 hypothetical protein EL17_00695 [Anditalea andensis]